MPKKKLNPNEEVQAQADEVVELTRQLEHLQSELETNVEFQNLLAQQKEIKEKIDLFWAAIEAAMTNNNIKSIKGEWGYITIAERIGWDIDEEKLPAKFIKKVVDYKKITDTYKLEKKAPKGATIKHTKYLTKRIK